MAEMAMAAWAFTKAAFAAVAAGTATAGQVATVIAINVAGSVALSTAATALMKPQAGSRAPGEWVADPNAGIPFAIGPRIGVAGNIVYKNTFGKDNEYKGIVTVHSGAGPIGGYLGFSADRAAITFEGEGVQGRYKGEMWMQQRLGNQPDTALTSPASISYKLPDWGPAHRLSGKASSLWTLRMDSKFSVYPQGEPAPLTTLIGIFGYDPRFDGTVPGGMGNCRWDDRTTWRTIQNGVIADLNWCLGLRENGKVVGGLGVSMGGVDLPAYMRAANVADANGWTVAAYPRSDENKTEVRAALLQAAGCVISRKAGKVSCISRGAPKTSVMTITADDTAGPVELDTAANVLNRLNSITPRYLDESAGWILAPAAPVSSAVYVDEDKGVLRSDARDYAYVPGARQAAQLAALDVAHSREGIAGRWPLKPYCRDIEVGEVFTVSDPAFLLNNQTMLCLEREYDPASDTVFVTFVSETPGKVAWALGQAANPSPTPSLSAWVPLNPPLPSEVVIIPRLPGEDGVEVPIIDVEVTPNNARADQIFIEWAPAVGDPPLPVGDVEEPDLLPWVQGYDGPAVAGTIPIQGPRPGQMIYLSTRYRSVNDGWSPRLLEGPVATPEFSIPGASSDTTPPAVPTGVALSSTVVANATTGEPEVTITATWTANTEDDLAGYEVEVSQGGNSIIDAAGTNRYTRTARSGAVYGIRVRAYDKAGNRSDWTVQQNVIGGLDTIPPAPPTAISANVSLGAFFLRWTAPADSDVAAVEVYESTSNTTVGAQLVATVPALPSAQSGVTISRPTGSIRWFFLRAVDTSKNKSAFTASVTNTIPSINGATDLIARSIVADNIALGTLTGDLLQGQTVTADKFATTGALPVGLTVGPAGATLEAIQARANDPAARINENTTRVEPGLISVGGGQDLNHWKAGPNVTTIRGGALDANSVTVEKLSIGARGLMIDRFNFRTAGNVLTWDGGRITWTNDAGAAVTTGVAAGSYTYSASGGDITYIYWAKGQGVLQATKSAGLAMNAGTVVIGAYYGGKLWTSTYGRTIIDETGIITPSLAAITGTMGTLTAGRVQSSDGNTFLDLIASRAQFRVAGYDWRQGSLGSGVVCWFGPTTVPIGSETRTNGVWAFGTDGKVYYGNAELGGAALTASVSPQTAFGSRPGGGSVSTNTLTLTISGPGAATATVRWVKSDETWTGPNRVNDNIAANIGNNGRSISFGGIAPVGGLAAATYLAVVTANGQSTTVVADVQLSDSN